jgi:hypothetical protein
MHVIGSGATGLSIFVIGTTQLTENDLPKDAPAEADLSEKVIESG